MKNDVIIKCIVIIELLARVPRGEDGRTVIEIQQAVNDSFDYTCTRKTIYNYLESIAYAGTRLGFRLLNTDGQWKLVRGQ